MFTYATRSNSPVLPLAAQKYMTDLVHVFIFYRILLYAAYSAGILSITPKKISEHATVYILVRHLVLKLNSGNSLIISDRLIATA
jgi:hypothetical protein